MSYACSVSLRGHRWQRLIAITSMVWAPLGCSLMIGELPDGVEPGSAGASGSDSGIGGTGNFGGASGGVGGASGGVGGSSGASGGGTGGTTGGAGGTGGTTGGTGGTGGTTGGTGGTTGGTGGVSGGCAKTCDCDGDKVDSDSTACGGTDCDDDDALVFPGQTKFFNEPSKTKGYDYNCDKQIETEFKSTVDCGLVCSTANQGWNQNVAACGSTAPWGKCAAGIPCKFSKLEDRTQWCR
jgi:hypothetical protein